jgi:anthrone oxygenase-like protein
MKYKVIYFGALFLLMLVTGVFWGTWFTLTRSISSFSAAEFIHIGQVIIANVAIPMSIMVPAAILLMITSLLINRKNQARGFYFGVTAVVLIIIVLLITLVVLVPIDNQIKVWTIHSIPEDWPSIRVKWDNFHTLRTVASLLSFSFYSLFLFKSEPAP